MHIASHFANVSSHASHLSTFLIMTNQSPLILFSDKPALGSNASTTQIFIGCNLKYIDAYGVSMDHDLSHTLEENIMN